MAKWTGSFVAGADIQSAKTDRGEQRLREVQFDY